MAILTPRVAAVFVVVVLASLAVDVDAVLRRCFSCRSRGDLGDCRDPFLLSSGVQVEIVPTQNQEPMLRL
jgi:hypothetical protein